MKFQLVSGFKPNGDQPQAIKKLSQRTLSGKKFQVLLGVTGSGKTFTIANVIQNLQKPILIISHNKTLAAQLYQELRDFFPKSAVSYFVSYYDYYQPEAYIPQIDTYIAKETEINEKLDKLRLLTTANIMTRQDTITVASVSCIYNLGSPQKYRKFTLTLEVGTNIGRGEIMEKLLDLIYSRNDYTPKRGTFRVRGETIEIFPSYEDYIVRVVLEEEKIKRIELTDAVSGELVERKKQVIIYPAKHYITDRETQDQVFDQIRHDLAKRVEELKKDGKELFAERLAHRTEYDLKMIKEVGYVNGIENYSLYFDGRKPGEPPFTLLDYFEEAYGNQWLLVIDESHMTIPQLRGMYNGDRSRKETLVSYGFRLPAAFDNRPLTFTEFTNRIHQTIFMSATPNDWEIALSGRENIAELLVRPTGIIDPEIEVKPTQNQIQDLILEIKKIVRENHRVLVTTLTKRMAEDLAYYLEEQGIKVHYLHSEVETLERQDILDNLRTGEYDVIVGINLLREGLDLPEVALVAILDADKEGFLRSKTSLIQTMGRAARRVDSKVILYADQITGSMREAVAEVERRRRYQVQYNRKHRITPKSVKKEIKAKLVEKEEVIDDIMPILEKEILLPDERNRIIKRLRHEMQDAARSLDFETAVILRDKIRYLKQSI